MHACSCSVTRCRRLPQEYELATRGASQRTKRRTQEGLRRKNTSYVKHLQNITQHMLLIDWLLLPCLVIPAVSIATVLELSTPSPVFWDFKSCTFRRKPGYEINHERSFEPEFDGDFASRVSGVTTRAEGDRARDGVERRFSGDFVHAAERDAAEERLKARCSERHCQTQLSSHCPLGGTLLIRRHCTLWTDGDHVVNLPSGEAGLNHE